MSNPPSTRDIGAAHEERAFRHLLQAGLKPVLRNYACKGGELDLIMATPDGALVFIEVRFRRAGALVDGLSTVGETKRKRFLRAVKHYLLTHPQDAQRNLRFDVVSVSDAALDWHQNAFDAGDGW